MADNAKWYVLHTYSGYENAVKAAIEKSVTNRGLEDMIHKMEIPMETVTEVTEAGVMKEVERKVFPGYVLIKMVLTDDTWHLVRNIRGVTGFVGEANGGGSGRVGRGKARDRGAVPCGRYREDHGGSPGQLHGHRGGDRTREEQGPGGGFHVWQRDPGGAGARPGGGPALRRSRLCAQAGA